MNIFLKINNTLNTKQFQTLLFLLFFSFIFYCLFNPIHFWQSLWNRISQCDGWALGDWLINYEDGGFKRRGLSGTTILFISRITSITVINLVFWGLVFLYFIFFTLLLPKFREKKTNLVFWSVLLSPGFFLFMVNDPYAFGRKEILLFITAIAFLYIIEKNKLDNWYYTIGISLTIITITLFHELVFFYIPYFFLMAFIWSKISNQKLPIKQLLVIGISSLIPILIIFFLGGDINQGKTLEILQPYGVNKNIMNGVMSWPKHGFGSDKQNALNFAKMHHYETYLISVILSYIPMILYIKFYKPLQLSINKFLVYSIGCLLFSWPIFYLTIDWGRWINIHLILQFLLLLLATPGRNVNNDAEIITSKQTLVSLLIGLFIIINSFSWGMFHCFNGFLLHKNQTYLCLRKIVLLRGN